MEINVTVTLTNIDGTPLKRPVADDSKELRDFTLKDACIDALTAQFKGEEPSFEEKFNRFKLALKVSEPNDEGIVNLDPEQCTKIMELVGKGFPPIIVGRVAVLLGKELT